MGKHTAKGEVDRFVLVFKRVVGGPKMISALIEFGKQNKRFSVYGTAEQIGSDCKKQVDFTRSRISGLHAVHRIGSQVKNVDRDKKQRQMVRQQVNAAIYPGGHFVEVEHAPLGAAHSGAGAP